MLYITSVHTLQCLWALCVPVPNYVVSFILQCMSKIKRDLTRQGAVISHLLKVKNHSKCNVLCLNWLIIYVQMDISWSYAKCWVVRDLLPLVRHISNSWHNHIVVHSSYFQCWLLSPIKRWKKECKEMWNILSSCRISKITEYFSYIIVSLIFISVIRLPLEEYLLLTFISIHP